MKVENRRSHNDLETDIIISTQKGGDILRRKAYYLTEISRYKRALTISTPEIITENAHLNLFKQF